MRPLEMKYLIEREVTLTLREVSYVETDCPEDWIKSNKDNFSLFSGNNTVKKTKLGKYFVHSPKTLKEKLELLPISNKNVIFTILEVLRNGSSSVQDIVQYLFVLDMFSLHKNSQSLTGMVYEKGHYGVTCERIVSYLRDLTSFDILEVSIEGASEFSTGVVNYGLAKDISLDENDNFFHYLAPMISSLKNSRISMVVHSTPYWSTNDFFTKIPIEEKIPFNPEEFKKWKDFAFKTKLIKVL